MTLNLKYFLYLPIIFMFIPCFSFYFAPLNGLYSFFLISLYISTGILLIFDTKYVFSKLSMLAKHTVFRLLAIFWALVCINLIFLTFIGIVPVNQLIRSNVMKVFLFIIPLIVYYICILDKYISLQKFVKIFMFGFWLNLILGIICFIGRVFDISFINILFDFFNNRRIIEAATTGTVEQTSAITFAQSYRISGLFTEPGEFANFIFIFLPFVYTYATSKIKLFNNKYFNVIFKYTLIPLSLLNLIFTQSPIYFIFSCLITLIYYFKSIFKYYKQILAGLAFIGVILGLFLITLNNSSTFDISKTFFVRVVNVLSTLHSFDDFIVIEQSLATRVVSYINTTMLFLKYPYTGVGYGNIINHIYNQYLQSPVSLTPEIINRTKIGVSMGIRPMFNTGFIYALFAENGIFIASIFLLFYYKLYIQINNIFKSKIPYQFYLILKCIKFSLIALLLTFIYGLSFFSTYLNLIIVLAIISLYNYKKNIKRGI